MLRYISAGCPASLGDSGVNSSDIPFFLGSKRFDDGIATENQGGNRRLKATNFKKLMRNGKAGIDKT